QPSTATNMESVFDDAFDSAHGRVPSPIFAMDLAEGLSNPEQSATFWRLAEIEFYDSPYFRMHHAYNLAKQGDMQRSFAKLLALVQEMPWLKEASLNVELYFKSFDPDGTTLMPDFQRQLRETIARNQWTTDGMHVTEIASD